ncbi:MAG: glycosyltransferase family 4 protein [Candidatus Omnitrophota bacterium]
MAAVSIDVIEREIKKADIVVLHWWHHPLMAHFLSVLPGINMRLVFWCHVSGCNYPSLPLEFIEISHKTLFTTQYTFDNPYWTNSQKKIAKDKAAIVYGLGRLDVNSVVSNRPQKNDFIVGYVGTLNFGKLHPDFIDYCAEVVFEIPTARFIMVGDIDNRSGILEMARARGISQCFEFGGYKEDVSAQLFRFDVFGYPLNPYHFGTTENALFEAMAFGLPVVALNQCAEKYIIEHGKSGYLAEDKKHYAQLIRYLYDNSSERLRLGENAKKRIVGEFFMEANVHRFHNACEEILKMKKQICAFSGVLGQKPYQWFLACLGNDRQLFMDSPGRLLCRMKNGK